MVPFRILIIIWKWAKFTKPKTYSVEGDARAKIVCIHQKMNKRTMVSLIKKMIEDDFGLKSQYIMLFHDKPDVFDSKHHKEIQDVIAAAFPNLDIRYDTFSGGKDFVYYKPPPQDTGLIDEFGDFGPHSFTSTPVPVYVYNPETEAIFPGYFNPVWNFYAHHFKYHLFDLKEQLTLLLIGLPGDKKYSRRLPAYFGNDPAFDPVKAPYQIALRFKPAQIRVIYPESPTIEEAYKDLKSYLEKTPLNTPDYLKSAAGKFRTILNLIPGEIY